MTFRGTCSYPTCALPIVKRQWCNGHYKQWRRGREFKPLRQRFETTEDRFWSKVDKSGGPDACWPWMGALHTDDFPYGRFRANTSNDSDGRTVYAHRFAVEMTRGAIPEGMFACHHCDNPPCCNPSHLFIGTPDDNVQDMVRKGRSHWRAKRIREALG